MGRHGTQVIETVIRGIAGEIVGLVLVLLGLSAAPAIAAIPEGNATQVQCPNDISYPKTDGTQKWSDGGPKGPDDIDWNGDGIYNGVNGIYDPTSVCIRVGVTDGFTHQSVGENMFIFGFVNLTDVPERDIYLYKGHAHLPAPTIDVKQGQKLYLTETNLGLGARPDIFDPHTVHFHGFPHAMAIFDGVPENSFAIPPTHSFTYFYKLNDPGTYPYHCHQEPTEHIQMGMTGMIVVHPIQDTKVPITFVTTAGLATTGGFAYNDGATISATGVITYGTPDTHYDVVANLFVDDSDVEKHRHNETIQEASNSWHTYRPGTHTINGRTYPETVGGDTDPAFGVTDTWSGSTYYSQRSSLVTATKGQRVLIRLVNLGYKTHTFTLPGVPLHVVGEDAMILRGPTGLDISYWASTFNIAGGKTADIIIDTTSLVSGQTYFLMARELNSQSSISVAGLYADRNNGTKGTENNYGMMTEIHIN